ncbi:MAG: ABC transporter ATP-binding protein [Chloroflexi bacterium]|nr:ABC transporter ATP-binding protein [Chloroflexota bacterium]
MPAALVIEGIVKHFGGLAALQGCSFRVDDGAIVGLIGPNGAGKTTLFNIISGILKPDSGHILFGKEDITGLAPYRIARKGIVRTFQITRVFPNMTVWENLKLFTKTPVLQRRAHELLHLTNLLPLVREYASDLSFGQQKLLELVRIMMLEPQIVLLDEPTAGVNPTMKNHILDVIHMLNAQGITFVIIEHDMKVIMGHCHKVVVLNFGQTIAEGSAEEIQQNEAVVEAYLGTHKEDGH